MEKWTENIIIADADYIDRVAFNLIVNFERMLGRRIPQADMARWAECIALDGGLRERPQTDKAEAEGNEQETSVILIHDHAKMQMDNFLPARYEEELNGQAFKGSLGEFVFSAISTEGLATKDDLFTDTLQLVCSQKEVKRLMVIPDEHIYNKVREKLCQHDDDSRRTTVFAMQPMPAGPFMQEILGYSLMAALGIKGSEISAIVK